MLVAYKIKVLSFAVCHGRRCKGKRVCSEIGSEVGERSRVERGEWGRQKLK